MDADLIESLAFENLVATISERFVNLTTDEIDREIDRAQGHICRVLRLDRSSLWQLQDDNSEAMLLTHLHQPAEFPPPPNPADARVYFPWIVGRILQREVICLAKLDELPPEARAERDLLQRHGTKSSLMIPLWAGEAPVFGILTFASLYEEREWPEALVRRLLIIGQIFANALARKRSWDRLRESEEKVRLAVESANAGLWSLDLRSGEIWMTDKTRELLGLHPRAEIDLTGFEQAICPEDRKRLHDLLQSTTQPGCEVDTDFRLPRGEGAERWLRFRGRVHCAAGQPHKLMGACIDITDRWRVHEELRSRLAEIENLKQQLEKENSYLREEVRYLGSQKEMVGCSAGLMKVLQQLEQVASTDSNVLIIGETGTGKELVARALHSMSPRGNRAMVKVNCAALPPSLIESELFGREKGSYTGAVTRQIGRFELADGGTIFLDEIGELPLDLQCKLLRVIQEGEFERLGNPRTMKVNVRVIAATNCNLADAARNGAFRKDLYYRLCVFPIHVPPLRERAEDIPLLAWHFIDEFAAKMGKSIKGLADGALDRLCRHDWPGNIRELRNTIEAAMIVAHGPLLEIALSADLSRHAPAGSTLADAERTHICEMLGRTNGKVKGPQGAAALLGLKPSTLYSKMERLGISPHDWSSCRPGDEMPTGMASRNPAY